MVTFFGGAFGLQRHSRAGLVLRNDGDAVGGFRLKFLQHSRRLWANSVPLHHQAVVPNRFVGQPVASDSSWSWLPRYSKAVCGLFRYSEVPHRAKFYNKCE